MKSPLTKRMYYIITKVINNNKYLFNGAYPEHNEYVGKPIFMAKPHFVCVPSEPLYFPKLKEAKAWLNKINAAYTRDKSQDEKHVKNTI